MIRGLRAALLGGLVVVALTGCETRVKESLEQKLQARADEGRKKVEAMLLERHATVKEKLPKDFAWDGAGEHPLQAWRVETAKLGYESKLSDMEPKYPGTQLQKDLRTLAAFPDTQRKYWSDAMDIQEYYQFLRGYAKDNPASPFMDDIIFDEVFVHASRLFTLKDVKPEDRPTSVFRYWQLAFDLPSKEGEGFGVYVVRLCEELGTDEYVAKLAGNDEDLTKELKDYCKEIPFEFRHIAIMAPYYDLLTRKLQQVKTERPDSPYVPVVDYLSEVFAAEKEALAKEFEEYPVLPDTMAATPAPVRLAIEIGPRGLKFADEWMQQSEEGAYALTGAVAEQVRPDLIKKLNDVRAAGAPDLKSGEVFLLSAREVPAGAAIALATAPIDGEENTLNQVVYLVGRRRFDGTNARASVPVMLAKGVPPVTIGINEGTMTCTPYGFSGEPAAEMPPATAALIVSKDRIIGGALNAETGALEALTLDMAFAELDLKKISDWAGEQKDSILVGVAEDATYDQLLQVSGPSAFRCKKADCTDAELRSTPKTILAICK